MTGGTNNTNAVPPQNEQRLVMLGKSKEHMPALVHFLPPNLFRINKMNRLITFNIFIFSAGDGKTDADDDTCRTFILRY